MNEPVYASGEYRLEYLLILYSQKVTMFQSCQQIHPRTDPGFNFTHIQNETKRNSGYLHSIFINSDEMSPQICKIKCHF